MFCERCEKPIAALRTFLPRGTRLRAKITGKTLGPEDNWFCPDCGGPVVKAGQQQNPSP
jgi:hypothetical protein